MNQNETLIDTFYSAFAALDYKTMQDCYHDEIIFSDPLFEISGPKAKAMWHLIVNGAELNRADFSVTHKSIQVANNAGEVEWEAEYIYSDSSRPVHNKASAAFEFKDGKIIKHEDFWDLYKWLKMAKGAQGVILGWSTPYQWMARRSAQEKLETFYQSRQE